jgi:Spy/CpxP family protein refolding chaperone
MQKLRFIAATLAAALCALALSVGAALAEEQHAPAGKPGAAKTDGKNTGGGLFCPLKDLVH